jgi:hypothetical protein
MRLQLTFQGLPQGWYSVIRKPGTEADNHSKDEDEFFCRDLSGQARTRDDSAGKIFPSIYYLKIISAE